MTNTYIPEYNYYLAMLDRRWGQPTYDQYLKWRTLQAVKLFS